jgi:5-methylcytosine-specific restriction endonuclease McrA
VHIEAIEDFLRWARSRANVGREDVEDGELLALLAQRAMAEADGDDAPTAERYRIIVEHCPSCGKTEGVAAELPDTVEATALCDAEVIDLCHDDTRGHHQHSVPPATRRAVLARDRYCCRVPGCRNRLWLEVHHVVFAQDGGSHRESNLITLCSTHHGLLHDGRLALEVRDRGWAFRFPDGQEAWAPWDVRVPPTWVPGTSGAALVGPFLGGARTSGSCPTTRSCGTAAMDGPG